MKDEELDELDEQLDDDSAFTKTERELIMSELAFQPTKSADNLSVEFSRSHPNHSQQSWKSYIEKVIVEYNSEMKRMEYSQFQREMQCDEDEDNEYVVVGYPSSHTKQENFDSSKNRDRAYNYKMSKPNFPSKSYHREKTNKNVLITDKKYNEGLEIELKSTADDESDDRNPKSKFHKSYAKKLMELIDDFPSLHPSEICKAVYRSTGSILIAREVLEGGGIINDRARDFVYTLRDDELLRDGNCEKLGKSLVSIEARKRFLGIS